MADKFNNPVDIPELSSSPSSPGAGYSRLYSKTDGRVYKKDAAGNESDLSVKGVAILGTPPLSPIDGEEWFDTETGKKFIYYVDADSSQWVETGSNGINGIDGTNAVWTQITQAAYDALSPPDAGTLYIIVG